MTDPVVRAAQVAAVNRYVDSLTTRQQFAVVLGHIGRRFVLGQSYADLWLYRRVERHAMTHDQTPDNVTELRRRMEP